MRRLGRHDQLTENVGHFGVLLKDQLPVRPDLIRHRNRPGHVRCHLTVCQAGQQGQRWHDVVFFGGFMPLEQSNRLAGDLADLAGPLGQDFEFFEILRVFVDQRLRHGMNGRWGLCPSPALRGEQCGGGEAGQDEKLR